MSHEHHLAINRAVRLAEDYGVRGFKSHPSVQNFDPGNTEIHPLHEARQRTRLPAGIMGGEAPGVLPCTTRPVRNAN